MLGVLTITDLAVAIASTTSSLWSYDTAPASPHKLTVTQRAAKLAAPHGTLLIKSLLKISKYIWDPARGGVLERGVRGGVTPTGTAAVSKHQTISGTQHEGACSRGGVQGGGLPPRHGCCVQASDYIWDPARGGVLEEGGPGGGLPPPGTAAVSKHQTISGTQHEGACSRGVRGGGYPPPPSRLLC